MIKWLLSLIRSILDRIVKFFWPTDSSEFTLPVYIKAAGGKTFLIQMSRDWDVARIKKFIAPKLGLQVKDISIILAGKSLADNLLLEECDLGHNSILNAVKLKVIKKDDAIPSNEKKSGGTPFHQDKPLCETLLDLQLTEEEQKLLHKSLGCSSPEYKQKKAHFYVYCESPCKSVQNGKLRVRCSLCKAGAFTVDRDPCCWDDVLRPEQVSGTCQMEGCDHSWAEFYFKCAHHPSQGEMDSTLPLYLVKSNFKQVQCLACMDISDPVLVFQCSSSHVICLECFQQYCMSRLNERRFVFNPNIGYTLPCPAGCENSLIDGTQHFKILGGEQYQRLLHFGAEEYVMSVGGVLCPQPGCGMGLLADPSCRRIQCTGGCEFVFCRDCLQGYHIDECQPNGDGNFQSMLTTTEYVVDPRRAAQAMWDADSRVTIRVTSKPCPKCRTPTERDGGCMHMICTRQQCGFHWCWVCQTEWTRECMGSHWFG